MPASQAGLLEGALDELAEKAAPDALGVLVIVGGWKSCKRHTYILNAPKRLNCQVRGIELHCEYVLGAGVIQSHGIYSRNKRGIAGNLARINFDRHALLASFQRALGTFVADADEIRLQFSNTSNGTAVFQSSVVRDLGPSISSTTDQLDQITITNSGSDKELATPWYSDQILHFDITLTGANEYGAMCAAKIFGVELRNEGSGTSVDDAVTEMSATFVARAVEPMSTQPSPFQTGAFRPSPCYGTIENHYRLRMIKSHIYI
jgi:hypothetical protein